MSKTLSAKHYQENKTGLQKRLFSFSREEKEKKWQYGHERYKNLSKDKKQKLVEYRKKYYKMRKIFIIIIEDYL